MDIIILGNGHSLKKVVEFGFDEFIEKCQKQKIRSRFKNALFYEFKKIDNLRIRRNNNIFSELL